MIRTFLAVELSASLRANLSTLQSDLKRRLTCDLPRNVRLSWVRPDSIHLTVKFLGDIDEALVLPMQQAIADVVRQHPGIDVPINRLGVFPRLQQPRVLWVGPTESWEQGDEAKRLASLHRAIEDCCGVLNVAMETRPLSPHLTLARIKEGERSFAQVLAKSGVTDQPVTLGSLLVDSIALIKSELNPTGSVYTVLWSSPLAPDRS